MIDYGCLNENERVRSNESRASDSVIFRSQARRIHAVPLADAKDTNRAACGYTYTAGSIDTLDTGTNWMGLQAGAPRCPGCCRRLGD